MSDQPDNYALVWRRDDRTPYATIFVYCGAAAGTAFKRGYVSFGGGGTSTKRIIYDHPEADAEATVESDWLYSLATAPTFRLRDAPPELPVFPYYPWELSAYRLKARSPAALALETLQSRIAAAIAGETYRPVLGHAISDHAIRGLAAQETTAQVTLEDTGGNPDSIFKRRRRELTDEDLRTIRHQIEAEKAAADRAIRNSRATR